MASPLTHVAAGWAIGQWSLAVGRTAPESQSLQPRVWLLLCIGMANGPDVDAVLGWLFGDMARFHNGSTHGLLAWLAATLAMALVTGRIGPPRFSVRALWLGCCAASHLMIDLVTWGRGLMLGFPFTEERMHGPFILFRGLRWSEGVWSGEHLRTALDEAGVILALIWGGVWAMRRRAKPE